MINQTAEKPQEAPDWMQQKERGSSFWLRIMCGLSGLLGRSCSRIVLHGICLYFLVFSPKARTASHDYLARCLQRPVTLRDLYRHILHFSSTIHDRIYLLQGQFHRFNIEHAGDACLHQHYDQGEGLLLLGAHLGSFEVLRATAQQRPGLCMSMAMYPENARQINQALHSINPSAVPDIIPLGTLDAMLQVHQRLKSGTLVGILADRAAGPDLYAKVDFLGSPADFPTGPFRMATMLRHPVYFMAGLYLGDNRYRIHFELLEDWSGQAAENRELAISALQAKYVKALERLCRAHPFNWFNFYDFWKES